MNSINFKSAFFLVLLFLLYSVNISSQCYAPETSLGLNISNSYTMGKSAATTLRMAVWVVNKDDGSGKLDLSKMENLMAEVAGHFSNYGIELDLCIRNLNNTARYEAQTISDRWFSTNCSAMNLTLYDSGIGGVTGAAGIPSNEGWSEVSGSSTPAGYVISDVYTAVHEIGHMLGLRHTFQGGCTATSECVNQYCTTISTDLDDYVIPEGDGLCDTPAQRLQENKSRCWDLNGNDIRDPEEDSNGDGVVNWHDCECRDSFFPGSGCSYTNSNGEVDKCGDTYVDQNSVLAYNFMNYFVGTCANSFTNGQRLKMHQIIENVHSSRIGTFDSCDSGSDLEGIYTGVISGETVEFENMNFKFSTDLVIENSTVWFKKCHLEFTNDFATSLIMKNSTVYLVDQSLIEAGEDCSGNGGSFQGVEMKQGTNFFSTANGCKIVGEAPFVNSSDRRGYIFMNDFRIVSLTPNAITATTPTLVFGIGNEIDGAISFNPPNAIPHYAAYGIVLRDSYVRGTQTGNITGLDCGTATVHLWNTEVSGFSNALRSTNGGILSLNSCWIQSSGTNQRAGVDITNALGVTVNNSRFIGANLKLDNVAQYSVTYNGFYGGCQNNCIKILLGNIVDAQHQVHNNFIESLNFGLISARDSDTKFLCNEFTGSNSYNFSWGEVNALQGFDQDVASGNLFSDGTVREVTGSSSGVIYNFFEDNPQEVLDKNFNSGVFPNSLDVSEANCGIIGPNWTTLEEDCPVGIDCTEPCPEGIDCDEDCPAGIDCTEPCPEGIDCTVPCPEGVDCTEPCLAGPEECTPHCPLGIDCTEPCPDDIDCTEPCPEGIDCTEPCPPGVNCFEPCPDGQDCITPCLIGVDGRANCDPVTPEYDPVIDMVETQYQTLNTQRQAKRDGLYYDSEELDELLDSGSIESEDVLQLFSEGSNLRISPERMSQIFGLSQLFYENEMVQIIKASPLTMYDSDINTTVFHSNSFSDASINELHNSFVDHAASDEVGILWQIDKLDREIYDHVAYAVKRLTAYGPDMEGEVNVWLSRLEDQNVASLRATQLGAGGAYDLAFETLATADEAEEANAVRDFISYMENLNDGASTLAQLSQFKYEQLVEFADCDAESVRSSAEGILKRYYDKEFDLVYGNKDENDKLRFRNSDELIGEEKLVKVYPNPSRSGKIYFQNNMSGELELTIYNTLGITVREEILIPGKNIIEVNIGSGQYYYTVFDEQGKLIREDKLILIE